MLRAIGERAHALRVLRNLRQDQVAERAGVGIATVRRFEKTGTASLDSALRIAFALDADAAFAKLFESPGYRTLDEALARPKATTKRTRVTGKK